MATAFVLINTETGSESKVVASLRKLDAVKEAHIVYGVYDVVTKVEAETMDGLKETIKYEVRIQEGVQSTLTLLVIE